MPRASQSTAPGQPCMPSSSTPCPVPLLPLGWGRLPQRLLELLLPLRQTMLSWGAWAVAMVVVVWVEG